MRNFWVNANIDGRASPLTGGPIRKDGGFNEKVYMLQNGEAMQVVEIDGRVSRDGTLYLEVKVEGHDPIIVKGGR